jgi:hypothetical protein
MAARGNACNAAMPLFGWVAPGPSRRAVAFIVASHAATSALLLALPLPLAARAVCVLAVAASVGWALWRVASRNAPAFVAVGLDGHITITRRDGSGEHGCVRPDTYVGATLVTLVWRPDGARLPRTLLVSGDSLDRDDFRRLRVALRYCRPEAPEAATSGADDA